MKEISMLNNEDGTVLVLALIMLVLLTLIGISATTTSMIETRIAGNERVYKQNFYAAEAASMHCAQEMEEKVDPKADTSTDKWLHGIGVVGVSVDVRDDSHWTNNSEVSIDPNTTRFMASSEGLVGGGAGTSLDMTKSSVHGYLIYGRCRPQNSGPTIIEIGFRKAF
jgi:Tfp pilus assembly protein PilX